MGRRHNDAASNLRELLGSDVRVCVGTRELGKTLSYLDNGDAGNKGGTNPGFYTSSGGNSFQVPVGAIKGIYGNARGGAAVVRLDRSRYTRFLESIGARG